MKKNYLRQISCLGRMALKWWLCLLLGGMLNLPATAQQKTAPRVNLKVEKTSLIRAIEALRSQTRYNFLFNSKDLQPYTDISVHLQSVTLQQALDSLLTGGTGVYHRGRNSGDPEKTDAGATVYSERPSNR